MADEQVKETLPVALEHLQQRVVYERPVLTHLGSVRELTLSGLSGLESGGGPGTSKTKT